MSERAAAPAGHAGLADRLRVRTADLHRRAERAGIVRRILRGEATLDGYTLYLRNLLPVYRALEMSLVRSRAHSAVAVIFDSRLERRASLEADLETLGGSGLPLLPSAATYASRIEGLVDRAPALLVAHAYARYLGDLNGGQVMQRLLERTLGLGPDRLSFYDFEALPDLELARSAYRAAVDRAGGMLADHGAVVEEAATAFALNIELAIEVEAATSAAGTASPLPPAGRPTPHRRRSAAREAGPFG